MSQESYLWWSSARRYSKYEIRKLKEKALQSYQQIDTVKEIAKIEQQHATIDAEKQLDQFITSLSKQNGK